MLLFVKVDRNLTKIFFVFFDGLIDLALSSKSGEISKEVKDKAIEYISKLKGYADINPLNFMNKYRLMEGELYAAANDMHHAKACYKEAIVHSKDNNFLHEEALALERAAMFHFKIGEKKDAVIMLQQSYQQYQRWGAFAKSSQLKSMYPDITFKNTSAYSYFVFFDVCKSSDSVSEITQSSCINDSATTSSNADSSGQNSNKRVRFSPLV